jgi:hypothetical protein
VPISSTNTSCLPSSLPNVKRHTNLSYSSRSLALDDFFRLWSRRLIARQIVASLTFTPHTPKRN